MRASGNVARVKPRARLTGLLKQVELSFRPVDMNAGLVFEVDHRAALSAAEYG